MITLTVGEMTVEAQTEKEARRELAKMLKAKRKEEEASAARYSAARVKAEANGYRLLSRIASGQDCPSGWRFYTPGEKWAEHLFKPIAQDFGYRPYKCAVNTPEGWVTMDHYGNDFIGAVCNGSGYAWIVFLRESGKETCYAIGAEGDSLALVDCPNVSSEWFSRKD